MSCLLPAFGRGLLRGLIGPPVPPPKPRRHLKLVRSFPRGQKRDRAGAAVAPVSAPRVFDGSARYPPPSTGAGPR